MNNAKLIFTLCISSIIITACGTSSHYFSIDYMVPAQITFPANTEYIAILDNTKPQDLSISSTNLRQLNTTTQDIAEGVITSLAETEYFSQITIVDESWKSKDSLLLPKNNFESISINTDANIILSIEYINAEDKNIEFQTEEVESTFQVQIHPIVQVYNVTKKQTNLFQLLPEVINLNYARGLRPTQPKTHNMHIEDYHTTAAYIIGKSIANQFTPHWTTVDRFMYVDPIFKTAHNYALEGKIEQAIREYKALFEQERVKIEQQIKIAYNIAVLLELNDQLRESHTWIEQSLNLAQKKYNISKSSSTEHPNNNKIYSNSLIYKSIIEERLENQQLLNTQMKRVGA